jgi:hypothetical protein
MCKGPVGEGAKRTLIRLSISIFSYNFIYLFYRIAKLVNKNYISIKRACDFVVFFVIESDIPSKIVLPIWKIVLPIWKIVLPI